MENNINNEPKKYFSFVYAALIVLAMAISYFVYGMVISTPTSEESIFYTEDGVNPGSGSVPSSAPYVNKPTTPPPGIDSPFE